MARLSLADISAEIGATGDDGFEVMLSDLGITLPELVEGAEVCIARHLVAFDGEPQELGTVLAGQWVQGCIAGIVFARKRESITWHA